MLLQTSRFQPAITGNHAGSRWSGGLL